MVKATCKKIYLLCEKEEEVRNICLLIFTKRNTGKIEQRALKLVGGGLGGGNMGEGDISQCTSSA